MNYDEMAEKIAEAIWPGVQSAWIRNATRAISAKLKELFPVPEDLEAAVEKILFVSGHFPRCDLKDGEFRSLALDRCVKRILTEVVAPLLAERDKRIAELETDLKSVMITITALEATR